MGYAGRLDVCPPLRAPAPHGSVRMLSGSPWPSATRIAMGLSATTSPGSVCLGSGSIEPMAARVDPRRVRARHQSMHHFVANAGWDDAAVLRVARETVLAALERHGAVAAWVVDDTGIPKK